MGVGRLGIGKLGYWEDGGLGTGSPGTGDWRTRGLDRPGEPGPWGSGVLGDEAREGLRWMTALVPRRRVAVGERPPLAASPLPRRRQLLLLLRPRPGLHRGGPGAALRRPPRAVPAAAGLAGGAPRGAVAAGRAGRVLPPPAALLLPPAGRAAPRRPGLRRRLQDLRHRPAPRAAGAALRPGWAAPAVPCPAGPGGERVPRGGSGGTGGVLSPREGSLRRGWWQPADTSTSDELRKPPGCSSASWERTETGARGGSVEMVARVHSPGGRKGSRLCALHASSLPQRCLPTLSSGVSTLLLVVRGGAAAVCLLWQHLSSRRSSPWTSLPARYAAASERWC